MWTLNFALAIGVLFIVTPAAAQFVACPPGLSTNVPFDSSSGAFLNFAPGATQLQVVSSLASGTYYIITLSGNCGSANASWTAQLSNCDANRFCDLSSPLPAIDDSSPHLDASSLCALVATYCTTPPNSFQVTGPMGSLDRQTSNSVRTLLTYSYSQPAGFSSPTAVTLRDLTSGNVLQGGTGGDFACSLADPSTAHPFLPVANGFWVSNCSCVDGNPGCFSSILSSAPWSVIQWNGRNFTRSPNAPAPVAPVAEPPIADPVAGPVAEPVAKPPIADPVADPVTDPIAGPIAVPETVPQSTPTTSTGPSSITEPTSTALSITFSVGIIATLIVIEIALM